jgi:hypothetical protein
MVTNERIEELKNWIVGSRLQAPQDEWNWYLEMADALEELLFRRRDASYRGRK